MGDKAKIRKIMVEHLDSIGKDLSDEQILNELKPMWLKIEEAGLIPEGMTFNHFQTIAHNKLNQQKQEALFREMKSHMNKPPMQDVKNEEVK